MGNRESTGRRARAFLQRRKNDLIYLLALAGLAFCRRIPLSMGMWIGGFTGGLAYHILRRERTWALEHLALAFSREKAHAERKAIAKKSFQNLGKNLFELINFNRIKKDPGHQVIIEGKQYLDDALAEGKGLLWITAHLGNWELMAAAMARKGYPVNVVARRVYDERLDRVLMDLRETESGRVILRDSPSASRQILQALKNREVLAMLIDQDTRVKGVMADFFGRKANTPAGPAILARRMPVPVLAGFIHRFTDKKHRIVICPPIEIVRTADPALDIEVNTERFNKVIEEQIRAVPEQWVWMHRRWRRRTAYQPVREPQAEETLSI